MRSQRFIPATLLLLSIATWTAPAQQAQATDSFPRYSRVTSVRELAGGRVLVSDAGLSRVDLLSPELRLIVAAAKRGEGPSEFRSSDFLLAVDGDSTLVVDDIGGSLLVLDGSAQPVGRLAYRRPATAGRVLLAEVRGRDSAGRLYFMGLRSNSTPSAPRDSAPLLRWTPTTDVIDTVTWIRIPVPGQRPSDARPDSMINARPDPFEWRDVWAVASDGRVAVVRGDDYHVDWFDGLTRIASGPAVAAPRVPVTPEDVQRLRDERFTINTPEGPREISAATGARYSTVKPFVADRARPQLDASGRLWVERTRAADADVVTYDVFGPSGTAVLTVQLANSARVVGFGREFVYVTKPDAGGRFQLGSARWPSR